MGQGRSVITIAHRLSTIADADMTLLLEDGLVTESGSHEILLAKGGRYAAMWARQSSEEELEAAWGWSGRGTSRSPHPMSDIRTRLKASGSMTAPLRRGRTGWAVPAKQCRPQSKTEARHPENAKAAQKGGPLASCR